jgi:hypothetical protein
VWGKTFDVCQTGRHSIFVKLFPVGFMMEFVFESNFFRRKVFVLFIAFSKRSHWAEMECHLSLLEQRKIDRAKNDQSFTSFEYKNPNKILKTLKAKNFRPGNDSGCFYASLTSQILAPQKKERRKSQRPIFFSIIARRGAARPAAAPSHHLPAG